MVHIVYQKGPSVIPQTHYQTKTTVYQVYTRVARCEITLLQAAMLEESSAAEASGEGAAAAEKLKATQGGAEKEKTFAETIAPLAEKVTAYILDHQDDAAQEDRWRTTMKRDMGKSFRIQHKAIDKQRDEVQKVQEVQRSMQQRLDEVHSKVDEKLDRIVKDLGRLTAV